MQVIRDQIGRESMEIKKHCIYILLTDTGTLFTKMIKWFTNAPYNHVSIVFDDELNEIYSFGRKKPRNPLRAGFIREDVYFGTYRYFENTRCLILKLEITEKEYQNIRKKIETFEMNKDMFSYNLLGLIGILLSYPINKNNSYFCSQFVAEVLQESGVHLWNLPPALVTPVDFFIHHRFEFVYEGKLYDYPFLDHKLLENAKKKNRIFELINPLKFIKKLTPL